MPTVETVRGPVETGDLGTTLMHEHVFVLSPDVMRKSHDASCYIDFFSGASQATKEQMLPNWHFEHIHHDVLPALREQGVTDEQITTMLVDNPRRYFS